MRPKVWLYIIIGIILLGLGIAGFIMRDTLATGAEISKLTLALERNPQNFDAAFGLGVIYFKQHDYSKSIDYYTQASKINPSSPEALNNLGNTYRKVLRYEDAEKSYLAVIELVPDYETAYVNLVNLYSAWPKDKGNKQAEIPKLLLSGLKISPNNPRLLRELIEFYRGAGDQTNANKYQKQLDAL